MRSKTLTRPVPVVIALGSNLGNRRHHLRAAIDMIAEQVRIVRVSGVWESDPIGCPPGSGLFLNMAISGVTRLGPARLLDRLHEIEQRIGRRRRLRNEPRLVDLDLIFYGARLSGMNPVLPHPRYGERSFVLLPMGELGLDWTVAGRRVAVLRGRGDARRVGELY